MTATPRSTCGTCRREFDGGVQAWCPACLAGRWLAVPNLVRPKHDPGAAAEALDSYRSIITPHMKTMLSEVLTDAAARGRWFWDRDYQMWVHVTERPLGRAPGVGIPAGREEADHALDCLFIAEADSAVEAHVFAVDGERHEAQIRAGVFEPLGTCSHPGCENLRRPGQARCALHG
jgi:hypothetical protein